MEDNPLILRLKELETLERLVEKVGRIDLHAGEGRGLDALLTGLVRMKADEPARDRKEGPPAGGHSRVLDLEAARRYAMAWRREGRGADADIDRVRFFATGSPCGTLFRSPCWFRRRACRSGKRIMTVGAPIW
jgi:hypothetical protein